MNTTYLLDLLGKDMTGLRELVQSWQDDDEFLLSDEVSEKILSLAQDIPNARKDVLIGATEEGSVIMEFREGSFDCTVEIQEGGELFLCIDDTATGTVEEETLEYFPNRILSFLAHPYIEPISR